MRTKNYMYLRGGIVGIHATKTVGSMVIASDGGGTTSFINVVCFPNVDISSFKVQDRVTIEGHIQLQVVRDENDKVIEYKQTYIADRVMKTPRLLDRYLTDESLKYDGGVYNDENLVYAFGKITHIYRAKPGVSIISIQIPRQNGYRKDNCQVVCFKRQEEATRSMKEGDFVMTAGTIRTKNEVDADGKQYTVHNIICRDILKVDGFDDWK